MSTPAGLNSRPMGRGRGRRGGENVEEVTAAMDKINNNVTDKVGEESAAAVWGAVQYGVPAEPVQESSALIDWDSLNANREENERRRYNVNNLLHCWKVSILRCISTGGSMFPNLRKISTKNMEMSPPEARRKWLNFEGVVTTLR